MIENKDGIDSRQFDLAPPSRIGHGLSSAEAIAEAQGDETPAQAVAVGIEVLSVGHDLPVP